jgi:oligopeptide/dipeptide ABC transporter ATP-binding protein
MAEAAPAGPAVRCTDVVVRYPDRTGGGQTVAVDGVSFDIAPGETVGLVGETGCGKTTLARAILALQPLASGSITVLGQDLAGLRKEQRRRSRKNMQCVFQDSAGSLNPRQSVGTIIAEGLAAHGTPRRERAAIVASMLAKVGLDTDLARRYPHELSGGQRQRVNIARALAVGPAVLIADEPVSALDVSIQSQILNLFAQLKDELGLTCLFVSHNLAVVAYLSDRIAVMYLGRIVEMSSTAALLAEPFHPYTKALLAAIPSKAKRDKPPGGTVKGDVPSRALGTGCRYRTRCPIAQEICAVEDPALHAEDGGRQVACHFAGRNAGHPERLGAGQAGPAAEG